MKKIGSLTAAGLALISGSKIATAEQTTTINKLAANGYNHEFITAAFHNSQININWNETLKIRADDEGKNIRLETLDHFSIVVPIESAVGNPNKIDPDLF